MNVLSTQNYSKILKKNKEGYSNVSNDNIYKIAGLIKKNKSKKKLLETNKQLIKNSLNKKSRNTNINIFLSHKTSILKNSSTFSKFKNLNIKTLYPIFSEENSGNMFEGYSSNNINEKTNIKKENESLTTTFHSNIKIKKDNIQNLKQYSNSYSILPKPLIKSYNKKNNENNNLIHNTMSEKNQNLINKENKVNKIKFVKRFSLLDKLLLKLSCPEETFEDFIHFSKPLRPVDKYKRFKNQLSDNKKKIDKLMHYLDINYLKNNKKVQSYTPDMLKKKYFLRTIYKKKNNI